jgi:NADH dehydrogenase FAD-containing subunit
VDDGYIQSEGRQPIPFDLLMLIPPFRGQTAVQSLLPNTSADGFARVNSKMQVEGVQGIYAAGDIVSLAGPRFGYMAMRQAKVAATNVLVELADEQPSLEYSHKVEWVLGEKHTHPNFFHYGVWDNTLRDFDENALLGLARKFRDRYGYVADQDLSPKGKATNP